MSTRQKNISAAAFAFAAFAPLALANPAGVTVVNGSASVQTSGSTLNVTVGQLTFLDWPHFNIAAGETTRFLQPGANSIVFNRIGDANPSQIWGNLSANGTVILANANGFYFGPNSMIQVGGSFIATTAPITPDFGAGSAWQFTGLPPAASIINYGTIETGHGGNLFLIAEQVENHGALNSPGGNITLAAGQDVLLSERPDGRGVSTTIRVPTGAVNNFGRITADAGTIALHARIVNQDGRIEANSVRDENGVVELVAGDAVNLGANSVITANGDGGVSDGGKVTIKSGGTFADADGSRIEVRGGAVGGNGGAVEISAATVGDIHSQVEGSAQAGFTGGKLLIDPVNLTLNSSSLSPYVGLSAITFQATHNITLAANTVWNLSSATGVSAGQLTLQAGNNITFGNSSRITDPNNWSVTLQAGYDFVNHIVQSGVGSIFLNGGSGLSQNGSIQLSSGNVNLFAGQSILVGSGSVTTIGGGSISASALAGDINVGTGAGGQFSSGYTFQNFDYAPYVTAANLGGISTAAGGNVTLNAGNNINSVSGSTPGLAGAFGKQAGDVTLIAGNQIYGNFNVANGTGTILAGVQLVGGVPQILNASANVGVSTRPVSLSLISGSWNVFAGNDVFINEVRNPDGTFNGNNLTVPTANYSTTLIPQAGGDTLIAPPTKSKFLFDYAADAVANFWAGNAITLVGANLPRVTGQNASMPAIYAPQLSLNAGAGGITIDSSIVLFPSGEGSLRITTRDGGSLNGLQLASSALTGITMSDSGLPGWATFAGGHALTPLHLNDANPVTLDISGGINNFGLTVPTFAHITVGGSTYNFGFQGRNLSPAQTTFINVAGDISYRGDLTSVPLTEAPPAALLDAALSTDSAASLKLRYDSTTGTLTFIGQMTASELAFLLNPTAFVFDQYGQPVFDASGNPVTVAVTVSAAVQTALNQLFTASQSATLGDQGLALAGPGRFNVSAQNMSLGISGGISVLAPDVALENISPLGAQLGITVANNLDMTSTKIANESYLGGISLNVGGTLDVGGQFTTFGDASAAKGIFTTSGGNVSVTAQGNVNVNGSRIAAYNGGNISVLSQHGDVNAGTGGAGYVSVNALELDPVSGRLVSLAQNMPGSGILATTLPNSSAATLGNITVNAPEGSINASAGGILQIAFNGASSQNSAVDLTAGHDINATGSGIIGSNIRLKAGGDINGLVVGSGSVNIDSTRNVNVTAFAGNGATISAGGEVSGTVVSGGNATISGDSVTAAVVSKSANVSGDSSSATVGIPQSNAPKADAKTSEDALATVAKKDDTGDDEKNKKGKVATLKRLVGRVTLLLSQKN